MIHLRINTSNHHNESLHHLENRHTESLIYVLDGLAIGAVAGLVSILYRFLLLYAESLLRFLLSFIHGNALYIAAWFLVLMFLGFVVGKLMKWEPLASGSGIPQVSGEIKGYLDPRWWKILTAKIVGGTLCIVGGLSLGREGPSIQLGAMAAKGMARLRGVDKTREHRMISCGAGAGLAAAFNAPLAGIIFVLEEIHHNFDKTIMVAGIVAAVTADFLSKIFFGQSSVFAYDNATLPLHYYWLLLLFGLLMGVAGVVYNLGMTKGQELFGRVKIPGEVKIIFAFLVSGLCGLVLPQILGGGHAMSELLTENQMTIGVMIFLLIAKYLFSIVCFGSGAPGGIFFPLLILGSYLGAIYGTASVSLFGLEPEMVHQFVMLGMAGFFASIVRAPITGIILIAEMTGTMNQLIDVVFVSIVSYVVANLLKNPPIYTTLLARILAKVQPVKQEENEAGTDTENVLATYVLPVDCELVGKKIMDIPWCPDSLVVSIEREGRAVTAHGDTVLEAGDELLILFHAGHYAEDNEKMMRMIYGEVE